MKKYIALGLVFTMMLGVTACGADTNNVAGNMDMLAQMMETADQFTTESQIQQTETQNCDNMVAAGENADQNQGDVNNNSNGNTPAINQASNNQANQQQNKAASGNANNNAQAKANNSSGNNNAQAQANNSSGNNAVNNAQTKANNNQAANNSTPKQNNQAQSKPASNNADKKDETTKATTKATTTVKKKYNRYYVCNGCGYKYTTDKGTALMSAHMKKQLLAGHDKCGSYRTATIN